MDNLKHLLNQKWWDDVTEPHFKSRFYDVDAFLDGKNTLMPLELAALGPEKIQGKKLLHLQCHFGLDTLSFARMGAEVVGVDFSSKSIEFANSLADKTALRKRAQFIQGDVLDWKSRASKEFDVVFTSYGVLCWLSDLKSWAEGIAASLKEGGLFYMAEIHPLVECMDDEGEGRIIHDYFSGLQAHGEELGHSDYATEHKSKYGTWQWVHSISEVIASLADAGLELIQFREYPYCCYSPFPGMRQREDAYWERNAGKAQFPMTFEIMARLR